MPLSNDFTFNAKKTVLKNIESLQKVIKSAKFTDESIYKKEDRKEAFTALFAMRMAVDAQRGKKDSLKSEVTQEQYEAQVRKLKESPSFSLFLEKQGDEALQRKLTEGRTHGGSTEDAFKEFLLEADKLPTDPPLRYMPQANERIEKLQGKLETLPGDGEAAVAIYAEIFRTRRAVEAVRGKGSSLKVQVDPEKLTGVPDIAACDAFKEFIQERGADLKTTVVKGHGGEAEELFRSHVLHMDHIPANTPEIYMPTALERTEALQETIREPGFVFAEADRKLTVFAELMGTRQAVGAVRGQKKSLDKTVPPAALQTAAKQWKDCETFRRFVTEDETEAARTAAGAGHGGALGDRFKEYVKGLDHLAADVPADYMPQGLERIEALQKKFDYDEYSLYTDDRKLTLYAEMMATRSAVGAVRGKKASLEKDIDPAVLNRDVETFKNCEAFKSYVREHDAEARRAAVSGHGGALEDGFKEHILNLDSLPQGIPGSFLPKGLPRIEALQEKIREADLAGPDAADRRLTLYAEILGTRDAVQAVRGKKASLDKTIDPVALEQARNKWKNCETFKNFLADHEADARQAALSGHAGALEDKFREHVMQLDHIPADIPENYMPQALERTEALQQRIGSETDFLGMEPEMRQNLVAELFATRGAVGAVRGKKDSLKKKIDPAALNARVEALKNSQTFRDFLDVEQNPNLIADIGTAREGHGGKLEDKFREFVLDQEQIQGDVPEEYMPTALKRTEALQKKLRETDFAVPDDNDRKLSMMAELLGARAAVEAVRGKKESLDKKLNAAVLAEKVKTFCDDPTFQVFATDLNSGAMEAAQKGHGGALEDKFREYVLKLKELPEKLPAGYTPTALDRIEALQKKIKSDAFNQLEDDDKEALLTELAATRNAIQAKRKDKHSLEGPVPLEDLSTARDKLSECQTFQEFLQSNPEAARKAALSGHGGELEDKFKEYVKNLDRIPRDVPKQYMPTALERSEVLQKKIGSRSFRNLEANDKSALYRELLATRMAVNSQRGVKTSLNVTLDAEKLSTCRISLDQNQGLQAFLASAPADRLQSAATNGHGGKLEDDFGKDLVRQTYTDGVLPEGNHERFRPKNADFMNEMKKQLKQDLAAKPPFTINNEIDSYKRRIAGMMYMAKVENDNQRKADRNEMLDHAKMEQAVDTLVNSQAFNNLFNGANAYQMVHLAANGNLSTIFTRFAEAGGRIQARRPQQPVLQQNPVQMGQNLQQNPIQPNQNVHQINPNVHQINPNDQNNLVQNQQIQPV